MPELLATPNGTYQASVRSSVPGLSMRVSGFSIIRNGVRYGYPVVEAVESILPLCDEFILNVGTSDDGTLALAKSIASPKLRIVEREWDMTLRQGGQLISVETNHALNECTGDWCFYIQADEALHEKYFPTVRAAMERIRNAGSFIPYDWRAFL
jgi:hypothetical protein